MDSCGIMSGSADYGIVKGNTGSSISGHSGTGSINWVGSSVELPTWASANAITNNRSPNASMMRVCSPMMTPRISSGAPNHSRIFMERQRWTNFPAGTGTRASYVIATTNSPPPRSVVPTSPGRTVRTTIRTASPLLKDSLDFSTPNSEIITAARHYRSSNLIAQPHQQAVPQTPTEPQHTFQPSFMTPRSGSRSKLCSVVPSIGSMNSDIESSEVDVHTRGRAWAFRSDAVAPHKEKQTGSEGFPLQVTGTTSAAIPLTKWATSGNVHVRSQVNSPMRSENTIYIPRASSPQPDNMQATSPSVVAHVRQVMRTPTPSFSWAQAPATLSPRTSFTWSPESFSPRASPRTFSPQTAMTIQKGMAVSGIHAAPMRR